MTADLSAVRTAFAPVELQKLLAEFDPMVTFKTVEWVDLQSCEGCPSCDVLGGCESTAVLFYRRYLRWDDVTDRPVHSHWQSAQLGECCLGWEIRQLLRKNDPTLELRVEFLREA